MTILTDSPSPNNTLVYVPRPNYADGVIVYDLYNANGRLVAGWAITGDQLAREFRVERPWGRTMRQWMTYADTAALRDSEHVAAMNAAFSADTPGNELADSERDAADESVEIDGRAYRVADRLAVEQLPERAAAIWRRAGVVAHVEVRRPRGRRTYIARQYADGGFSRPWRGSLIAN